MKLEYICLVHLSKQAQNTTSLSKGGAVEPASKGLVSCGQPLSFWERVWSNAIELPVLVPTIIGSDRNAQMYDLTALNAESTEQMALLHLTRLFPRRKEAGHARLAKDTLEFFLLLPVWLLVS